MCKCRESSRLTHCMLWAWWWVSRLTASVDWIVVICSSKPSAIGGFRVIWNKSDLHSCLGGSPFVGVYSVVTNLHWRGAGVEANLNVVTARLQTNCYFMSCNNLVFTRTSNFLHLIHTCTAWLCIYNHYCICTQGANAMDTWEGGVNHILDWSKKLLL